MTAIGQERACKGVKTLARCRSTLLNNIEYDQSGQIVLLYGTNAVCLRDSTLISPAFKMPKLKVDVGSPESILNSITDAFYFLTKDWNFAYVNHQAGLVLGYQPDELLGKNLWEVYPGLIGTELETSYRKSVAEGISTSFTFYFPDHKRWYEVHCYPSDTGLSAYFRNATAKIERDKKLQESETHFRMMANAIPQIVWITDAEGRVEFFNQQWYAYTGNQHDLNNAGQVSAEYVHPDDHAPTIASWEAARQQGATFLVEHRIRSASGEYRWFLVRGEPYRDPVSGKIIRWYGTSTDVHDRKVAEQALQESEVRFRTLTMATAQIVWRTAPNGEVIEDSPSWRVFTGQSYDEWKGFGWTNVLHPEDSVRILSIWKKCIAECTIFEGEYRLRGADGKYRWTSVRGVPVLNSDRSIREWIGTNTDITEAKEAQEQLHMAEEQLRLATDAAELGIWVWEVDDDIMRWENDRVYEMFGLSKQDEPINIARFLAEVIHPEDAQAYEQKLENCLQTGERLNFIGRFYRPSDRDLRWFEITGLRQAATIGVSRRMVGTVADITHRKRAEKALTEAQKRLEATLTAGEVGTWILDLRTNLVMADRNLAMLFGIPDAAASTPLETFLRSIHPDDIRQVRSLLQDALATEQTYKATYRVRNAEGKCRWVIAQGRIERDANGTAITMPGVLLDVTSQREAEEQLRKAQERYRTVITSMDAAFSIVQVLLDATGKPIDYRFEEVNRAFEQQAGLVNAAGKTIREMVPNIESHWIDIYGRVALTREPARFTEHSAAMGYWWDVYATPIGEPHELRIAILFTDITARKQAEVQLQQVAADLSESNRRKTAFLATLAHELRNPLAPIRTGLDLLRVSDKSPSANANVMSMMGRQLDQMVHLINDLMDVSRINSGKIVLKKECTDLRAALTSAVESVMPAIETFRHKLDVQVPSKPIMLEADPIRLAQIMTNLLTNAAKYTPNGGHIALSARQENEEVIITVIDSGMGIPEEELSGLFEMFSQVSQNMGRSQGGLGIGLSLVKSLVEMHGGTVMASSQGVGKGSTFTVRLPLTKDCGSQEYFSDKDGANAVTAQKDHLNILIADDNQDAAMTLATLLQTLGHATVVVHDGMQAVQRAKLLRPNLVILDIGMPVLNGYEAATEMRQTPGLEDVALIALTGWGAEEDRQRTKESGFDAHLIKPAGMVEIQRLLSDLKDKFKIR